MKQKRRRSPNRARRKTIRDPKGPNTNPNTTQDKPQATHETPTKKQKSTKQAPGVPKEAQDNRTYPSTHPCAHQSGTLPPHCSAPSSWPGGGRGTITLALSLGAATALAAEAKGCCIRSLVSRNPRCRDYPRTPFATPKILYSVHRHSCSKRTNFPSLDMSCGY
jgi:hypothetical protein